MVGQRKQVEVVFPTEKGGVTQQTFQLPLSHSIVQAMQLIAGSTDLSLSTTGIGLCVNPTRNYPEEFRTSPSFPFLVRGLCVCVLVGLVFFLVFFWFFFWLVGVVVCLLLVCGRWAVESVWGNTPPWEVVLLLGLSMRWVRCCC